ncbi:MAG: tRNA (5-methylaminomethyl-2-thiouridine)(34)-methyltransferase MnmD [Novipirellula sp. JB048]
MKQRSERKRLPCGIDTLEIEITDDGSRTLKSRLTGDSYHSASGGLTETRQVYLRNSGVEPRLTSGQRCRVLEIGLGTGMGMLVTVDCAARHQAPLYYVAVEYEWLAASVIGELDPASWVNDRSIVENYLSWRATVPPRGTNLGSPSAGRAPSLVSRPPQAGEVSVHRWQAGNEQVVEVHLADALRWEHPGGSFDAIYFDPFAPHSNTELWQVPMLRKMEKLLSPTGRLVTYCVKREVRDRLSEVGFVVQKLPGPAAGKREVLVAAKEGGLLS